MHTLKTYTLPGQKTDTYLVYWTNSTYRLGGLLHVKIAANVEDKAIAAELAAIQNLLEVRCVLGNKISGNAKMQLVVSSGAIRKLQRCQSDKVHLAPYANFLCTRFAAAIITVEKDTRWFNGKTPAIVEELQVSGPQLETIRLRGLGEVSVTRHVLDRFVDRVLVDQPTDQAMQLAWKKLSRLAEHHSVKEVSRHSLWAGVIHNRHGKQEGRYFLNSVQQMVMVVTDNPNEGPRLVTTYPVTRHFRKMAQAA